MAGGGTSAGRRPARVGIAADHAGFELKRHLARRLQDAGVAVVDFGATDLDPDDDYPDYVIPLALAVARGDVDRGIACCGSGVGASVAANKVAGVRAALIGDTFSAHQGVEDDDLNILCLGGRVIGLALAWDLAKAFLGARFAAEERFVRRLRKIAELERKNIT